jgi:hypothetical protein
MPGKGLRIRREVSDRLHAARLPGESVSDFVERLLEDQYGKTVGEFRASLAPLDGRGVFTAAERERLRRDPSRQTITKAAEDFRVKPPAA